MKAWLCLKPGRMTTSVGRDMFSGKSIDMPLEIEPPLLALLPVFRTKEDARAIYGKDVPLQEVDFTPYKTIGD